MDHMMPQMDGIETTKKLREMGYSGTIVALTANALSGNEEMFMQEGFDGFISKPIDTIRLNEVLNKFIRDEYSQGRMKLSGAISVPENTRTTDKELLRIFVNDGKNALSVIKTSPEDMQTLIITIHAMKSALYNIGEKETADLAAELEKAGKTEDKELFISKIPLFTDKLTAIIKDIEANHADEASSVDSDPVFLKEALERIITSCEDYNFEAAETAVTELREKKWTPDTLKVIDEISNSILHSNLEEVIEIATRAIQVL